MPGCSGSGGNKVSDRLNRFKTDHDYMVLMVVTVVTRQMPDSRHTFATLVTVVTVVIGW